MYKFVTYSTLFSPTTVLIKCRKSVTCRDSKIDKGAYAVTTGTTGGIKIFVNEEDVTNIEASIEGPGEYYS